jgi:dihydrofolate reductase
MTAETTTRHLFATYFMTLDGVVEDPSWSGPFWNDEIAAFKEEETNRTDALLLGRVTYEAFAQAWPTSPDEGAEFFNSVKKYVVSTTQTEDIWENATFIADDVREAIINLKEEDGDDLAVHGSISLTKWLLKEGLLDELRLLVYPIVRGSGRRLFDDGTQTEFVLENSDATNNGVLALVYRPKNGNSTAASNQ